MVRLKARSEVVAFQQIAEFQFLMVRLKANLLEVDYTSGHQFQFLMVRLKAASSPKSSPKATYFNSLWFD